MKYNGNQFVKAVYDTQGADNPLLEAMPELMHKQEFERRISNLLPIPENLADMKLRERKRRLSELPSLFIPMDYMYGIYDTLYRMMQSTYITQTARETARRVNKIIVSDGASCYGATQAETGSLLGTPGIGKTGSVRRCLSLMPQVIAHEKYRGNVFFCKQVSYLFVECPSDCSIKTMAYNIVQALDYAAGTNHLDYMMNLRSVATSSVSTYLKTLCLAYHVGVIVIDEIQNVVETAKRTHRIKPLIRFLVELTNDTSTSIYFVGTPIAETVFTSEEHLRRRTRGMRLIPFKADGVYRAFLEQLWQYQYTAEQADLTDKLANKLYDYSGGIPDYLVKLFREAQNQAILQGESKLSGKSIQAAANALSITPPKYFDNGVSLSDFDLNDYAYTGTGREQERIRRSYATQRGRKAEQRDENDLLVWFKRNELSYKLSECEMMEVLPLC